MATTAFLVTLITRKTMKIIADDEMEAFEIAEQCHEELASVHETEIVDISEIIRSINGHDELDG